MPVTRPGSPGDPDWQWTQRFGNDPAPSIPLGSIAPFHQADGVAQTSTGAGLTIPWPYPHQKDDIGILIVESSGDNVTPVDLTSQGWTLIVNKNDVADATGSVMSVWWRRADNASQPDVVTQTQTDHQLGRIIIFRNAYNLTAPINVSSSNTKPVASTTTTFDDITTTHDKQLIVMIASRPNDSAATNHFGNPVNGALTGIARIEAGTTDGNGGGFSVSWGVKALAGVVGAATQSKGTSTTDTTLVLALSPEAETGGSPQNLGSQIGTLALTAIPSTVSPGNANLGSQVATLTLTALSAGLVAGGVNLPSQVATLTLTAVPGAISAARSLTSQIATLTLTAIPGTITAGPATLGSQTALLTLTAVPSTVQGAASLGSQTALLTLTALPSTVTPGPVNLSSQRATLTLTAVPGVLAAGGVNLPSQVALLTLTAVPGTVTAVGGPQNLGSQVAQLSLTAIPGALQAAANLPSQTATLTLTATPGTLTAGGVLLGSQTALLTLTAVPGQVLVATDQILVSNRAFLTLTAVPGRLIRGRGTRHGGQRVSHPPRARLPDRPKRMRVEYGPNGEMRLLEVDAGPEAQILQPLPPVAEPEIAVLTPIVAPIVTSDDELILLLC